MNVRLLVLVCAQLVLVARAQYDYADVLGKSILFYEAQRSGDLPETNRIPWRGDSSLGDGSDVGADLAGGWHDAGDHVKLHFPMAFSATALAWGIVDFRAAYENSGQLDFALDQIKWPLDYFMKCYQSGTLVHGQVGDGNADHAYWGRPEDMTMFRPTYPLRNDLPGSDLAGEIAASLAAGSMAFQATDPTYAATLLASAREHYDFAYTYRGIYSESIPNAASFYGSTGYNDELSFGAAWLYRATGEADYLAKAQEFQNLGTPWAYSWDDKNVGAQLVLWITTQDPQYSTAVESFIRSYMPGGSVPYTPQGLAWRDQWGSLRYAANAAFIALVADKQNIMTGEAGPWAKTQIDYMLGDTGRSYVCGFGTNPPRQPHHRAASCNDPPATCDWYDHDKPDPNPQVLNGALVGGPDQNDYYEDVRSNFVFNEVACDYNAGFQGALAGLL